LRHNTPKVIRGFSQVIKQEKLIEHGRVNGSAMRAHDHLRKLSQSQDRNVCTIEWNVTPYKTTLPPSSYSISLLPFLLHHLPSGCENHLLSPPLQCFRPLILVDRPLLAACC